MKAQGAVPGSPGAGESKGGGDLENKVMPSQGGNVTGGGRQERAVLPGPGSRRAGEAKATLTHFEEVEEVGDCGE